MSKSKSISTNEQIVSENPVTENMELTGPEDYKGDTVALDQPEKADRLLQNHSATFNFKHSGCNISVGCKTFAFSSNDEALRAFEDYVLNPGKAYETWLK